jgi:hypothetical protein
MKIRVEDAGQCCGAPSARGLQCGFPDVARLATFSLPLARLNKRITFGVPDVARLTIFFAPLKRLRKRTNTNYGD